MASLTLAVSPKSSALTISLFILVRRARDGAVGRDGCLFEWYAKSYLAGISDFALKLSAIGEAGCPCLGNVYMLDVDLLREAALLVTSFRRLLTISKPLSDSFTVGTKLRDIRLKVGGDVILLQG
jgi:hypothetical protein